MQGPVYIKCGCPWLRLEKGSSPPSLITANCFVIALHFECFECYMKRRVQTL